MTGHGRRNTSAGACRRSAGSGIVRRFARQRNVALAKVAHSGHYAPPPESCDRPMPLVDPVIERVLADFERRAEEEQRRTFTPGAPGTSIDDLLLSVGREAGILLYL